MKKSPTILILAGTLALGLTGCDLHPTDNGLPNLTAAYQTIKTNKFNVEDANKEEDLECKILHVQPSQISFEKDRGAASFEFEYVVIEDHRNAIKTLIYPSSKAIIPGRLANIRYLVLPHGAMNAQEFLDKFVQDSEGDSKKSIINFKIQADGVIKPDGIRY